MDRFEAEALMSNNRSDEVLLVLLIAGLRERTDFWMEVQKQDIQTLTTFHKLANRWKGLENSIQLTKESRYNSTGGPSTKMKEYERRSLSPPRPKEHRPRSPRRNREALSVKYTSYSRLNSPRENIFLTHQGKVNFGKPPKG